MRRYPLIEGWDAMGPTIDFADARVIARHPIRVGGPLAIHGGYFLSARSVPPFLLRSRIRRIGLGLAFGLAGWQSGRTGPRLSYRIKRWWR